MLPKNSLRRLNSKGLTAMELVISMAVLGLVIMGVPPLLKTMAIHSQRALAAVHETRQEHAVMATLLKDIKSARDVEISADGKSISVRRGLEEVGVQYSLQGEHLYYEGEILTSNITGGEFSEAGNVIAVDITFAEADPIHLLVRKANLKSLVDSGNVPLPPEFDRSEIGLHVNDSDAFTSDVEHAIVIPVVPAYEVTLKTADPLAQILWYTVNHGDGLGSSERVYVQGNQITFETKGILNEASILVKVVAEDGISMITYSISLMPQSTSMDTIPDWMWGGCEAFRTYMRRLFSNNDLTTITFGDVRIRTGMLDMRAYNITDIGEIIGEFKGVTGINVASSAINTLPNSLGQDMPQLTTLNLNNCTLLNYQTFQARFNNSAWKSINCPNLVVTWP